MLIKRTAIILCGGKSSKGYKNKAFKDRREKIFGHYYRENIKL